MKDSSENEGQSERIDPSYYRAKADLCMALAERPENRHQAQVLIRMARRFMARTRPWWD